MEQQRAEAKLKEALLLLDKFIGAMFLPAKDSGIVQLVLDARNFVLEVQEDLEGGKNDGNNL